MKVGLQCHCGAEQDNAVAPPDAGDGTMLPAQVNFENACLTACLFGWLWIQMPKKNKESMVRSARPAAATHMMRPWMFWYGLPFPVMSACTLSPGRSAARLLSVRLIRCLSAAVKLVMLELLYIRLVCLPDPLKKRGCSLLLPPLLALLLLPLSVWVVSAFIMLMLVWLLVNAVGRLFTVIDCFSTRSEKSCSTSLYP